MSSTGNPLTHLRVKHGIELFPVNNQVKITDFMRPKQGSKDLDYYFLLWIALDNLPLSKVDGTGFRLLMKNIANTVKIPSRNVLTRRCLPTMYNAFKAHVQSLIASETRYYTLAIDIWTDDFQKIPYLASFFTCDVATDTQEESLMLGT